jgi:hypothetical protein
MECKQCQCKYNSNRHCVGAYWGRDTVYYTVTKDGCIARAMMPIKVIPLSAYTSLSMYQYDKDDIRVYPNPNNGEFMISGTLSISGNVQIEVMNILGQIVYNSNAAVTNGTLHERVRLTNNTAGIYLLTLHTPAGRTTFHFVIR